MAVTMQQRRDTAANWTSSNPVLAAGEIGYETDTGRTKLGNGTTAWASMPYWQPAGQILTGADPTGATDSSAAFTAAAAAGGTWSLAPGTYTSNSGPWLPASGFRLLGPGRQVCSISTTSTALINAGAAATDSVEIGGIALAATGAHLITGASAKRWYVHDCSLTQNSAGFSCWNGTTGSSQPMVECCFRRNEWFVLGATRTVECIFLTSGAAAQQVNGNSWKDEVFFNQGNDQAMYMIHIQATGSNNLNETNIIRDCLFEHPYGGMVWLESATGSVIDNVQAYDMPSSGTISNHLVQISKNATGLASGRNRIHNFSRIQGGAVFASNIGDIGLDANCYNTTILAPDGSGGLVMYLNGSKVKLLSMPDGGWGIGDSAFTLAVGANAGTSAPAPVNSYQPDNQSGTVTFGTGTGPAAGAMVTVTFGNPFQEIPQVLVTPFNAASAALNLYPSSPSATGFTLSAGVAPAASQGNTIYGFRWLAWA